MDFESDKATRERADAFVAAVQSALATGLYSHAQIVSLRMWADGMVCGDVLILAQSSFATAAIEARIRAQVVGVDPARTQTLLPLIGAESMPLVAADQHLGHAVRAALPVAAVMPTGAVLSGGEKHRG